MDKYLGCQIVDVDDLDRSSLNAFGASLKEDAYYAARHPICYPKGAGDVCEKLPPNANALVAGTGIVFFSPSKSIMKSYMILWQQGHIGSHQVGSNFNLGLVYGHYKGESRKTTLGTLIANKFGNPDGGKKGKYKYADAKMDKTYHNITNNFYFCYVGTFIRDPALYPTNLVNNNIDVGTIATRIQ